MHAPLLLAGRTGLLGSYAVGYPLNQVRRKIRPTLFFTLVLIALDLASFSALYLFALRARLGLNGFSLTDIALDLLPLVVCLGAVVLTFIATHSYSFRTDMLSSRFAAEHFIGCIMAFLISLFLQFSVLLFDGSRSRLALIFTFIAFTPLALFYRRLLYNRFIAQIGQRTLLIVGGGHRAAEFYQSYLSEQSGYLLRFIDFSGLHAGHPVDGAASPQVERMTPETFWALIDDSLEAVVLADRVEHLPAHALEMLVQTHFSHVPILTLETFYEQYWVKIPVSASYPYPYWALQQDFRLARDSSYRFFKRCLDLVGAALALILALIPMALCVFALWLEGSGPIFYRQARVKRDRKLFTLYKFRTMRANTPSSTEDLYSQDNDVRITPVGRWLRRMRLDELPQLWNVLKGDMSLIGPRAEWINCVEIYERDIPCYHFRHLVKPGITGWAQVNYPYGASVEDTVNKLKYDLYYIKNYSLMLDATIVLKTLYVILSFKGK